MVERPILDRVRVLEQKVEKLESLPAEVGALRAEVGTLREQFVQFRAEVRGEFSAIRQELHDEIEETRHQARLFYEDLVERLKVLGEGRRHGGLTPPRY